MKTILLVLVAWLPVAATAAAKITFKADAADENHGLAVTAQMPTAVFTNSAGRVVVDFGKDAFGWLEMKGPDAGGYEIVLGELVDVHGFVTNAYPRSTIRAQRVKGDKPAGTFRVPMPPDAVNTRGYDASAPAIRMPSAIGVVFPFRYAEIVSAPRAEFVRQMVSWPIDMSKSSFACDNANLCRVYEFCKYSIIATSFCGIYVDGDRERTPYEGDAYINQLSHYAIDNDYTMGRRTLDWLIDHPTWPTEWRQHTIMMAWTDWMWSGDSGEIVRRFDLLSGDWLSPGTVRGDGLIVTSEKYRKLGARRVCDIVDWPPEERDGFVFCPVNAVVNAFRCLNLRQMSEMADVAGKGSIVAERLRRDAERAEDSFRRVFFDSSTGLFRDGEGSNHHSLHANAAALAFGLAPKGSEDAIAGFLGKKGMACSVYFVQYLLEGLCRAGRTDLAVKLMSATGDRSWIGMMDFGSTITMEAWNIAAKPNLDLNHAWASAPLNVISRFILGVTPIKPGFAEVAIRPTLGGLSYVKGVVPTARGPVSIDVTPQRLKFSSPVPSRVTFGGRTEVLPAGYHVIDAAGGAVDPTFALTSGSHALCIKCHFVCCG